MKFINYPIVHFSLLLTFGIITAYFLPFQLFNSFILLLITLLLLLIFWLTARKSLLPSITFGVISYICFFFIGYFNYQYRLPSFQPSHYSHFYSEEVPILLQFKILEELKSDPYNLKYIGQIEAIQGKIARGKILISIQKDSMNSDFAVNDILLVSAAIKTMPIPQNPHQFDYSKYMQTLGVYGQIQISEKNILKYTHGSITVFGLAQRFRNFLLSKLQSTSLETDERAIIEALALGQKKDISKELYSAYADAGAIHILAVSGLHVGILFFILSVLFKPIKHFRYGNYLFNILLIAILWCFAFISGLSPSVTRAVTMFSFLISAETINRQSNTINALFLSFFVLLLYNPLWLFNAGFQLSYLAVFSIIWVQPMLYKYYRPQFFLDKIIWDVLTVSLAAQLGVLPLSLYYFHQFPALFFVTNLVVIPGLGIILGGSLLYIILSASQSLPTWYDASYNYSISKLNDFIRWIASREDFLFKEISFTEAKMCATYLLIIFFILFCKKFSYKKFCYLTLSFNLLLGTFILDKYKTSISELVIFQSNKASMIGFKQAENLVVFKSDSLKTFKNAYPIKSYRISQRIHNYTEAIIPKLIKHGNEVVLFIDSSGVYPNGSKIDIVILIQNPKIHLERLIDSLKPRLILADGSNFKSYISRWQRSCEKRKIPFYHTGSKGAYNMEL